MGLLTGKFDLDAPPPKGRENQFTKFDKKQLNQLIDLVRRIAEKYQREPSAIALNWCIVKGTIPLGGARTASHVTQNVKALDFRLTPEEVEELDALAFVGENNNRWNHG